ncbi:hypothetical protein KUH03_04915 [Sphingobacterium sp. E70]|uniref:hypothetical protein n=1 Tax=Sphingobacterium sp. E70 TaxID=2853439 RepID=UPI00211D1148|nr:hypothetical protein [Sphingobacterium sp. E70]ULT26260.1 hypothetical protein KUH03_04915 [Sphingobacterium sp. E70]
MNEKGVEQTTEFAIENWWLTDNMAYENKRVSSFYIQAVENSEVLYISQENQEKLMAEFPLMERYFRFVYQRAYAAAQMRVKYLFHYLKRSFIAICYVNTPSLCNVYHNILLHLFGLYSRISE